MTEKTQKKNIKENKAQVKSQNSKMEELEELLKSKNLLFNMINNTIFPALKSKIKNLEEQLLFKEQQLEIMKIKEDLNKIEIDSFLPLPI